MSLNCLKLKHEIMYKLIRNIGLVAVSLGLGLTACDEDYPKSHIAPYDTELLSIKIVNAGADGNTVVEGTIDEANKTINFPRLDLATDFSALSIEAELSEGAALQSSVLDFSMDEETASKTLILRIVNQKRYKEYFIRVRKRIPVYGADFEKPVVYDFSGDHIYPDYGSLMTRCASYDGEHVLVVSRKTAPHLLKVADLKQGQIKPIMLDLTGVSGGTYPYNMGALANGHVYIVSLSGGKASPLKIYYWETPDSKPEVIANINVADIPDAANRHGDNISVNIDKNGNGFIFFGDNTSSKFLRLTVSNHKTIDAPKVLLSNSNAGMVTNVFRIEDTDQYVWAGLKLPVTLVDESLSEKYKMNTANLAIEAVAPRIFTFNGERYLLVCTAAHGSASKATPSLIVYNLTKGSTVEEAMQKFDEGENHNPDYTFILGGSGNAAGIAQTDYYIEKDENGKDVKLCIFGSRTDSGFVICEFPIKQEEED